MSSPEPRISSHSTTDARGGSAALIGPAARRRPVSGATGPGAAAGGGGGGRAGGAGRERPYSPARPGSGRRTQRGELASASPRSDRVLARGVRTQPRRGLTCGFIGRAGTRASPVP